MRKLSKYEQETSLLFNEEEEFARVYTCKRSLITKLKKLSLKNEEVKLVRQTADSANFIIPKEYIKIKPPTHRQFKKEVTKE